jgi:RecA-family ATPase
VLIVSTEDDADELYRRIYCYLERAAQANGGLDTVDVLGRIDCLVRPKGVDWSLVDSAGRPTAAHEALNEIVQVGEYALVVLDTLSRLGNDEIEKSPTASRKFVELLEQMTASPSHPTVLMLHHMRKAESNGKRKGGEDVEEDLTADSIRGTSGLVGGVRFAIIAQPQDGVVRVVLAKSNYGPRTTINLRKGDHGVIWGRAT